MQERIKDPQTGLLKVVSVKCSGTSERAKQEAYRALQSKIEKLSDTNFRFFDTVDVYLSEMQRTWKPSSYTRECSHFKSIKQILGDAYLDSMTAGFVRMKFISSGKKNRTINDYQASLKMFWRWAYRNDFVKSLEVADKLFSLHDQPKKDRIQDKYLEVKELKKLLSAMKEERYRLLSRFMCLTGMRIGEVIALDNSDVWGAVIRVNKTWDLSNRIITAPKTAESRREIHVQPELKDCIEEIRKYMSWQAEVCGYQSDIFFPDLKGQRLVYSHYNEYLAEVSETVLGRRVTPHIFRHTHCSMLVAKGMSYDAISARLGHEDSKITKQIYTHRLNELREKENKQLDRIRLID